jgi:hypothetical protein
MKLRIHNNSLRFRLSQSEVTRFIETGRLEDSLEFGSGSRLAYELQSSTAATEVRAEYEDGRIRVVIPSRRAQIWAGSDEIGISGSQRGSELSLLIEKDFQCLHRAPGQEPGDADAFPNPLAPR